MPSIEKTDVVVVGAGPAGLTAAGALRANGVDVIVLESAEEGASTSRAAVIHARTLEVLEPLGVTPRLLDEGVVVPVFSIRDGDSVLGQLDFGGLPTRYPFTLMLPQSRTEAILATRLNELGGRITRRRRVEEVTRTATGAQVVAVSPDGSTHRIDARFVIGADGADSTVRHAAGIGFRGEPYAQSFVLADVVMDWPLPREEVQLFFSPDGLVVVAPLPGGRHRIVATMDDAPAHPDRVMVDRLVAARGPGSSRIDEVVWSSRFRVHHRLATAYRAGPMFLVGDAAHVHSPAGGQGMNTGVQDAVDLARTLAEALRHGRSSDADLDGYERRRRPVATDVIALTDRMTRVATLRRTPQRRIRNTVLSGVLRLPAARYALARRIAELA